MKKIFIGVITIAISSIALAQNVGNTSGETADSTTQHPAANKNSDTTVPSRDGVYSNSNRQRASQELDKKKTQGRNTNGVIDEGAPGGIGQPKGKGQSNPTLPQTE